MKEIRVFVASPDELAEEREAVALVVAELDRVFGRPLGMSLRLVRWETHSWPDIGDDAQDVINQQIGEFDVFVGVMWKRFGTPTRRADSGTGEEFDRAYEFYRRHGRPRIMFYFRTMPFYTAKLKDLTQFRKVVQFRGKLEKLGVLYWTYHTPIEFERRVREHLMRQLIALRSTPLLVEGEHSRSSSGEPQRRVVDESVFLAYNHQDKERVRSVYWALRAAGLRPWLDEQDLTPGQQWMKEIERAITNARVALVFVSSKSTGGHGYIAKELEALAGEASNAKMCVVVVRLDPVEIPPKLRALTSVDMFAPSDLEVLIQHLKRLIDDFE